MMSTVPSDKTFIIAELSANHNNNFDLAVKTIEAIAASGADAVKLQTYKPESLTLDVENQYFVTNKKGLWRDYTPWKLFEEASMPYEWQPELKKIAEKLGLICFSSPFDYEGVDFLEKMDCPIYKVASPEIVDLPLIKYMAKKGKPMIISTGMASISDIDAAINACRSVGNNDIILLKCTSEYPAPIEKANLLTIPNMKETFGVRVGLSDHTFGHIVPVVAVTLGATVVEKHFVLDRSNGGPDAAFSMEPKEFEEMVRAVRDAEKAIGTITYEITEDTKKRRRSLFVVKDIKKGEKLTTENIRSIRPGVGLAPKYFDEVLGRTACKDLKKGEKLDFSVISNSSNEEL
jgi:pseudaminic acid synthase